MRKGVRRLVDIFQGNKGHRRTVGSLTKGGIIREPIVPLKQYKIIQLLLFNGYNSL
jgi:hypothetical protein